MSADLAELAETFGIKLDGNLWNVILPFEIIAFLTRILSTFLLAGFDQLAEPVFLDISADSFSHVVAVIDSFHSSLTVKLFLILTSQSGRNNDDFFVIIHDDSFL